MSIQTLSELFLEAAGHDKPDCLIHKVGGRFVPVSTAEFVTRVHQLHKAFSDMGIGSGDKIALMAENSVHWPTIDFATLCTGAVLVPVYPTLTATQAAYIINDCGARVAVVDGNERLSALLTLRDKMPEIERFIVIDDHAPDGVATLDETIAAGEGADAAAFEIQARSCKPDDLATFIYTSGTTGNPKGVMLSHRNIVSNILGALEMIDLQGSATALSFLPLSHSFERTLDYIYFYRGCSIAYAESVQKVAQNFGEVRPHIFVSVPRVYEKILGKVREKVAAGSPVKQKIFAWAEGVAKEALPYRLRRQAPGGMLGIKLTLADKLVFGKIKDRLGGRFEFAMSGGAPLARDLAEFFWGAGIEIYEGYGLSETSPVLTVNCPGAVKMGTVGRALPGIELHIAEDGEILAKGPNIMVGYHNLPEKTAEAIDDDGWFHTGDIGTIDDEGFLKITDRKKELIVNAYGKNVAPAPLENRLKASMFIAEAVVIGDQRKFLAALLVPDFETLEAWAGRQGISAADNAELLALDAVQELFRDALAEANKHPETAKYERVHAFNLLTAEFSVETGELTPTQKIKRRIIRDKYADEIESMYAEAEKK